MIIFGELTFFTASGYFNFAPDEFDYEFGAKWKLPPKNSGGGVNLTSNYFCCVADQCKEAA